MALGEVVELRLEIPALCDDVINNALYGWPLCDRLRVALGSIMGAIPH